MQPEQRQDEHIRLLQYSFAEKFINTYEWCRGSHVLAKYQDSRSGTAARRKCIRTWLLHLSAISTSPGQISSHENYLHLPLTLMRLQPAHRRQLNYVCMKYSILDVKMKSRICMFSPDSTCRLNEAIRVSAPAGSWLYWLPAHAD